LDYGQAYLACRSQAMRGVRFNQKSSSITTFRFRLRSALPARLCAGVSSARGRTRPVAGAWN
jgi:hypothetical protein